MKQLTLTGLDRLDWLDVPAATITTPQSALLRPIAVATCDFDHLIVAGLTSLDMPIALGHEFVGEVVGIGTDVHQFRPGDRVIVPYQINCGACSRCLVGDTGTCETVPWLSCYGVGQAGGGFGGAMSDLVAVPFADTMLVALPDGISPSTAAALSCNLPDAYRCVDLLIANPGARVLVVGGVFNSIALYAIQIAIALGASGVDYFDPDPVRLAQAAALGATVIENRRDIPIAEYPITVNAGMDVDLLGRTIAATAPSGTCTISTMYSSNSVPIPLFAMFQNAVTLRTGQPHTRSLIDPVLQLVNEGRIQPDLIATGVVDWADAPHAFASRSGKTVCTRH